MAATPRSVPTIDAGAAEDTGAAEDDRGDGEEFVAGAGVGFGLAEARGVDRWRRWRR